MKRKLAVLLAFIFTLTLAVPSAGFAANMDKALENAIKIAKTKFEIPEDYKFSSNISNENGKNIFNLNWISKDSMASANINVRIDEKGTILGYSKYSQSDYIQARKLPKFSKQDAKSKADEYIKWIEPGLISKIKYEENNQNNGMIADTSYYLTYYRVVNGLPFYSDRVTVTINRDTGALQNYMRQWTDGPTFPALSGVIPVDKAQQAYMKNIGLRLIYKYTVMEDTIKPFAVYAPIYDTGSYAINALTGERQRIYGNYYAFSEDAMPVSMNKSMRGAGTGVQLSPDELKAVQNASKLMSQDEAEKTARAAKFLTLSADAKLQSSYLGESWPSKEDYVWSLQFNKSAGDKSKSDEYTSVTVNAKTGEILSFYRGPQPADPANKPKGDMTSAKTAVDAFLKEYYPQYFKQTEYDARTSENNNAYSDNFYTFNYSRIVNGTAFPDNGINVNYDNTTGTITSFNLNWFNIAFPSVDKAIGAASAGDMLFKNVGIGLEYKFDYLSDAEAIKIGYPINNTKVVLVYCLNPNKPYLLDANTGALLNADGTPYKEATKVSYTDIKGNAAEKQIMVLADNGIYLDGMEFKPDSAITQQDFLTLLSKTMNYYGPVINPLSKGKEIDDLYAFLQREGVIKAGEKAPSSTVMKEDAVKYLIRALKYDKVADIKGIFNIAYKDKSSISPNLTGYVAIAAGLGIIDAKNPYFKPKAKLTRGESAILIYNYLQS